MSKRTRHLWWTGAAFEATGWTLVQAFQRESDSERRRALQDVLCRRILPPVYGYIRSRGYRQEQAEEIAQSFFVTVVLGRELLDRAQPSGRLHSLIITSLKNYLVDCHRRDHSGIRRSNIDTTILADEERRLLNYVDDGGGCFDESWARSWTAEALERCEAYFAVVEKSMHWSAFELCVLNPAIAGTQRPTQAEVARALNLDSPGQVASMLKVAKERFIKILEAIAYETSGEAAEDELRSLYAALGLRARY